jgi:hypothetical protein
VKFYTPLISMQRLLVRKGFKVGFLSYQRILDYNKEMNLDEVGI